LVNSFFGPPPPPPCARRAANFSWGSIAGGYACPDATAGGGNVMLVALEPKCNELVFQLHDNGIVDQTTVRIQISVVDHVTYPF
jgi:hypothetical protein